MFPDFPESDIAGIVINRAIKVQPLQVIGYSGLVQAPRTKNPDSTSSTRRNSPATPSTTTRSSAA
jgi:hypothetical protein